jgi:dCMP deaminase
VISKRSEDPYHKVGAAVFRKDNSIAGAGYNGAPAGIEIDWTLKPERAPKVIHAEVNALRWTTPNEIQHGWLASTKLPCANCLTVVASYGIKTIVYLNGFSNQGEDVLSFSLAQEFGINLTQMEWAWQNA